MYKVSYNYLIIPLLGGITINVHRLSFILIMTQSDAVKALTVHTNFQMTYGNSATTCDP